MQPYAMHPEDVCPSWGEPSIREDNRPACGNCGEQTDEEALTNYQYGKHLLNFCPDCFKAYTDEDEEDKKAEKEDVFKTLGNIFRP